MPRFRKLMLIKCPKFFTGECDHTCPHFSHFLLENCNEDCPSCPVAVRNRCPCVDHAQVEAYWHQAVDEHTLLPARMVVPSSLVPQVAPHPALVRAIRRRGELVFPLVVRPSEHGRRERYEVVASQELYSAARKAGLDRLPVIIKRRLSDEQALALIGEMNLYTGAIPARSADIGPETGTTRFPGRGHPHKSDSATPREGSQSGRVANRETSHG